MARSYWKGKFIDQKIVRQIYRDSLDYVLTPNSTEIYTKVRSSVFIPLMLGSRFYIHNGRNWFRTNVFSDMMYNPCGKYSWTKLRCIYKSKKKKKKR